MVSRVHISRCEMITKEILACDFRHAPTSPIYKLYPLSILTPTFDKPTNI